jgi:hypothetical protein
MTNKERRIRYANDPKRQLAARATAKAWRAANPVRYASSQRKHRFKKLYGLTIEELDAMLVRQHGRCAICGTMTPKGKNPWHVDHDHTTGKVRGILCSLCNAGLGFFKDDRNLLRAALNYLL